MLLSKLKNYWNSLSQLFGRLLFWEIFWMIFGCFLADLIFFELLKEKIFGKHFEN